MSPTGQAGFATRWVLILLLKARRGKMSQGQRRRGAKPARWLYPWAVERRYAGAMRLWARPMREYVQSFLRTHSEAILRGDGASITGQAREDAIAGKTFKLMVNSLNAWVGKYVPEKPLQGKPVGTPYSGLLESPIYAGLGNMADSAFDFNGGQYEKSAKSALGIDFPADEEWWKDARSAWIDQNYELIRSDFRKYISEVNTLTEKAVMSGWSVKTLGEAVLAMDRKLTQGRANFIARDQIGKLNGQITQARMESVGLTMYEWSTSMDERVRSSHRAMDRKLCRWDDGSVYSEDGGKTWKERPSGAFIGHPGQDYQCRCTALAYWQELVNEVDKQIDGDETPQATTETPKKEKTSKFFKMENVKKEKNARYHKHIGKSNDWFKSLTKSEKNAMMEYTGTRYKEINKFLFGEPVAYPNKKAEYAKYVKELDAALKKYPLDENIIIYRGDDPRNYSSWEIGGKYPIHCYQSCAVLKGEVWSWKGMTITIHVPKGTRGAFIDGHGENPDEEEYLLARGLSYKVLKKTKKTMVLEVVNE
jgi:SPP1 gp7 family putative phage head morphogenesis protein